MFATTCGGTDCAGSWLGIGGSKFAAVGGDGAGAAFETFDDWACASSINVGLMWILNCLIKVVSYYYWSR